MRRRSPRRTGRVPLAGHSPCVGSHESTCRRRDSVSSSSGCMLEGLERVKVRGITHVTTSCSCQPCAGSSLKVEASAGVAKFASLWLSCYGVKRLNITRWLNGRRCHRGLATAQIRSANGSRQTRLAHVERVACRLKIDGLIQPLGFFLPCRPRDRFPHLDQSIVPFVYRNPASLFLAPLSDQTFMDSIKGHRM